jgi:hypothetical protein
MVTLGLFLGHRISGRGVEVDRCKVEEIENLPYPRDISGTRSFLGHAGFFGGLLKISLKFINLELIFYKSMYLFYFGEYFIESLKY